MTRSTTQEILNSIFALLETKESKNISEIAQKTNIPNRTIKKYVELIEYIQAQPKLIIVRTGHSYQLKMDEKI